jgi:hypothetical protein
METQWTRDFVAWQTFARSVDERAARVRRMIYASAVKATREAGLDPGIMGIHLHNAWIAYENGEPWREVNYDKVRLARWLSERQWEPSRLADRITGRAYARLARQYGMPYTAVA